MKHFSLNGYVWQIKYVDGNDMRLIDRIGRRCLATTDPAIRTVYLSNRMNDHIAFKVLMHEIGHCVIFSYDLVPDIHRMVKRRYWIEAEEWMCNFIAEYAMDAICIAANVSNTNTMEVMSYKINQLP